MKIDMESSTSEAGQFNIIGWILLLGMGASWIGFGYSSWYLLLLPLTNICF